MENRKKGMFKNRFGFEHLFFSCPKAADRAILRRNVWEKAMLPSQASAYDPAVLTVLLYDPEGAFRLDGPVHSKERSVGTVQVLRHFPVYGSKLSVHTDRPGPLVLLTSLGIWVSAWRLMP